MDEMQGTDAMKLALVGGNPKGHNEAFHPNTLSGKRLRRLLAKLHLDCRLCDMTTNVNDIPSAAEIRELQRELDGYQVVFLGRFVERHLQRHFPNGVYLPHPASRRKADLANLERGLHLLASDKKCPKGQEPMP